MNYTETDVNREVNGLLQRGHTSPMLVDLAEAVSNVARWELGMHTLVRRVRPRKEPARYWVERVGEEKRLPVAWFK